MKYFKLLLALLIMSVMSCKDVEEAGDSGSEAAEQTGIEETTVFTPFTIDLDGIDNLIVKDDLSSLSTSALFATYDGGNLFTNKDGQVFEVELPIGHTVKKVHDVKDGNTIAITFYVDSTADAITGKKTATCVLTEAGLCELDEYEPRKLSNLGNSPHYQKTGDIIRYLTADSLIEESESTGSKTTTPFAANGQLSINQNGHMMIFDGVKTKIKASFDLDIPDIPEMTGIDGPAELFPNTNKFFIPHKDGFMVKGGLRNDFYRVSDSSGDLEVRMAQENAYYRYINIGGTFSRIWSQSELSSCTSHIVGDNDIMICGSKVYDLGDASNDINEVDFWSYGIISGSERVILSDDNFLYIYSSSYYEGEFLARVELNIEGHLSVFDRNGTSYKISSATISNGTYRACTDDSILEITTIDATPDITETTGECDQIVSF